MLTPAGPAVRAWAWAIDFSIWLVAVALLSWLLSWSKLGNGLLYVAMFITYWGYPIICEVYFDGRTIGKRVVGIEVLRSDGLPVGWRESTLRNLLLVADFLPIFYATGLVCMLFDVQFRRLGDLVAGTQVVYHDKPQKRPVAPDVPAIALPFPLSADQQRILTGLFEREKRLPLERLHELGTLAEALTGCEDEASLERLRGYVAGLCK